MSWQLPVTSQRSGDPLTPEQLAAGRAVPPLPASGHCTREQLLSRIAACRACEHVARGGQTCAACDLRCAHPLAAERPPLLAVATSTCPANLWPVSA